MKRAFFFIFFFKTIFLFANVWADEVTAERMMQFADFLYNRSDYYRAAGCG